ncbi:MAG: HAMP domain-containing sensor histidine kinase [Myxococcota bacterium]|nr:HAMP domain-containing sensor histidine kinase [Myxococcota bacterium]
MSTQRPWLPGLISIFAAAGLSALLAAVGLFWGFRVLQHELDRQTHIDLQHQAMLVAQSYLGEFERAAQPTAEWWDPVDEVRGFLRYASAWELPSARVAQGYVSRAGESAQAVMEFKAADPHLLPFGIEPLDPIEYAETPLVPKHVALQGAGRSMQPWLDGLKSRLLSGLSVIDHHGDVVASSEDSWIGRWAGSMEEVATTLNTGWAQAVRRKRWVASGGPPMRSAGYQVSVVVPIEKGGYVLGAVHALRTPESVGDFLVNLPATTKAALLIPFLLMPFALVGAAQFFAVGPMRRLVRQARLATALDGGGETPLARPRSREVGELSYAMARMATELRRSREAARAQAESFAHMLKNRLLPANADSELLANEFEKMDDDERRAAVERIREAVRDGTRLSQKALAYARARVESATGRTEPGEVLLEIADAESRIEVQFDSPPDATLPAVAIDENAFEMIFRNLVDNAATHGASWVGLYARRRGSWLCIHVSDDGPGIARKVRERVFEPFWTSWAAKGSTGLGLAHTRRVLDMVGGSIEIVDSARGARFEVLLPLAD